MGKKKSLKSFVTERDSLKITSIRVEEKLVDEWEKQLDRDKLGKATWFRAAIKQYLDQRKSSAAR